MCRTHGLLLVDALLVESMQRLELLLLFLCASDRLCTDEPRSE